VGPRWGGSRDTAQASESSAPRDLGRELYRFVTARVLRTEEQKYHVKSQAHPEEANRNPHPKWAATLLLYQLCESNEGDPEHNKEREHDYSASLPSGDDGE
jgi:hypothetical protein